jgi:hypothetical protein
LLGSMPTEPATWLAGKIIVAAVATAVIGWSGNFLKLARHD